MKVCMFVLNNCKYDTRGLKEAKLIRKVIDTKFTVGHYHWKENGKIIGKMRSRVIVDGRQIVEPEKARKLGFTYKGIGGP